MRRADDARLDDTQAIVAGDHPDPVAVLRMHEGDQRMAVRAFPAEARSVTVLDATSAQPLVSLQRVHDAGLFAGSVDRRDRFAYRLVVDWGGRQIELDDPYRFPPWLGALDLHL